VCNTFHIHPAATCTRVAFSRGKSFKGYIWRAFLSCPNVRIYWKPSNIYVWDASINFIAYIICFIYPIRAWIRISDTNSSHIHRKWSLQLVYSCTKDGFPSIFGCNGKRNALFHFEFAPETITLTILGAERTPCLTTCNLQTHPTSRARAKQLPITSSGMQ
jgi:hypothetical protein